MSAPGSVSCGAASQRLSQVARGRWVNSTGAGLGCESSSWQWVQPALAMSAWPTAALSAVSDCVWPSAKASTSTKRDVAPVVTRRRPIGLINLSDIIKYESQSSLYLVSAIYNKQSAQELKSLLPDVRATFVRMARDEASAHMIGSAMSGIGRSFTQRLLELAEDQLGPPPVPYAFMALGSMARDEQLVVTDQDNALVLDDRFDPARPVER